MNGVTMQTHLGTNRPVEIDDVVQSLKTHRAYAVTALDPDTGRPTLYRKGHRRIHNANPKRYRIIERAEVSRGQSS